VRIAVEPEKPSEFDLYVRIPAWCQGAASPDDLYRIVDRPADDAARISINGRAVEKLEIVRGYARLRREWKMNDRIDLTFDMPARRVKAHPKIVADVDRVALMRGPIVYCLEGIDNPAELKNLVIEPQTRIGFEHREGLLGGVTVLRGPALALRRDDSGAEERSPVEFLAIPYYANCNRDPAEMRVWINDSNPAR
jgi:DUF1680 family protein